MKREFLVDGEAFYEYIKPNIEKHILIEEFYITDNYSYESNTSVRVRKMIYEDYSCECFMTIQSDGCADRERVKLSIPLDVFNELLTSGFVKGDITNKVRYMIPLDDLIVKVDIYSLITAEIEFESLQSSISFKKPDWFGKEITYDSKYKNRNLAKS